MVFTSALSPILLGKMLLGCLQEILLKHTSLPHTNMDKGLQSRQAWVPIAFRPSKCATSLELPHWARWGAYSPASRSEHSADSQPPATGTGSFFLPAGPRGFSMTLNEEWNQAVLSQITIMKQQERLSKVSVWVSSPAGGEEELREGWTVCL